MVAVHNATTPQILWWTQGLLTEKDATAGSRKRDEALQRWPIRQSSTFNAANGSRQTTIEERGESKPLFQCSPVVRSGRLFITTRHENLTSLNCLSARTGDLIWQQPLVTHGIGNAEQHYESAVVGGVLNDVVICLLAKGLMAGCQVSDGSIAWLQNVLTADVAPDGATSFALASQADPAFIPAGHTGRSMGTTWLQLASDHVVCGRQDSAVLFCLDASNGSIRWSTSRAVKNGLTSGQYDLSCIGQIEQQLIMAGYSHVRAIDVKDGSTTWVRPIGDHQGRVAIHNSCIYVGSAAGRLLGLDADSGAIISSQPLEHGQMGNQWTVDHYGLFDASTWQISARSWSHRDTATTPSPLIRFADSPVSVEYDIEADSILTPAMLGSIDSQFAAAESLLAEGRRLECELLLLNVQLTRGIDFERQLHRRDQLLRQVREPILSPGFAKVDAGSTRQAESTHIQSVAIAKFEETSSDESRYKLQRFRTLLKRQGTSQYPDTPPWYANRFLRVEENRSNSKLEKIVNGEPRLSLVNVEHAHERSAIGAAELSFPRSVAYEEAWSNPALCVVQKRNSIGVLSLYDSDPLSPRWLRTVSQRSSGQVIALNSHRLVVIDNEGIQALHPFDGCLLWKRRWQDSQDSLPMHGQFFKIYQTADHIILLSALGTSSVVLDGEDGEILKIARYDPRPISRIVGRQFVFADEHGELHIQDLLNGGQRAIGVSQVSQIDNAGRLRDDMVMVVTSAPSIVFVDVPTGRVVTNIDLKGMNGARRGQTDHPLMTQRSGLVFVASTRRDWQSRLPPTTFGEGQIGSGVLACVDPHTWQPLWQDTCRTASIPHIYGDPCPYLVTCSSGEYAPPQRGQRNSYVIPNSTTIHVREATTGRPIGQLQRAASSTPLRINYNRKHDQLEFTFSDTTIRMTCTQ